MPVYDFHEFEGDRRLLWIAKEWESYADKLADWAMERLANRRDVWSQYTLKHGQIGVVMLPIKERRVKGAEMVTLNKLRRHFSGHAPNHLIGLHSISDHATCKWFAIDVDLHDESVSNADEIAFANFNAAFEWANRLRTLGMDPLLFDSNGVGGYHIWVLLDREYPLLDTFNFVSEFRMDWAEMDLPRKPEVFPPKGVVKEDDLPYTLRLPGRHHKRAYYTRVWNFDGLGENEWLEGGEAIEAILAAVPSPLPKPSKQIKEKAGSSLNEEKPKKEKKPAASKRKPRVCVDLDGVLASYEGWEGPDQIGAPLPGALEFAKKLDKIAEIVIFTTRCSADQGNGDNRGPVTVSPGKIRVLIKEWLEKHEFPFSDVYIGEGKPRAAAFIDDRAISCRPQDDETAFSAAHIQLKELLRKKR